VISPDFAVGCIEYDEGIVARVTCSIVAPKDKSMTIIGDDGVISTSNVRDEASSVFIEGSGSKRLQRYLERHVNRCQRRIESFLHWTPWAGTEFRLKQKYPFARQPRFIGATEHKRVDFCRGPAEMSAAIRENRPCRLSAELGLHVTELVDALQYPDRFAGRRLIQSTFTAMEPLVWGH
jgi:hypothetical protein